MSGISEVRHELEKCETVLEAINYLMEYIDPRELDRVPIGEIQAFIDLSREVRMLCLVRRG